MRVCTGALAQKRLYTRRSTRLIRASGRHYCSRGTHDWGALRLLSSKLKHLSVELGQELVRYGLGDRRLVEGPAAARVQVLLDAAKGIQNHCPSVRAGLRGEGLGCIVQLFGAVRLGVEAMSREKLVTFVVVDLGEALRGRPDELQRGRAHRERRVGRCGRGGSLGPGV